MKLRLALYLLLITLFIFCAPHKKSNIESNEEFIIELKNSNDSKSRGLASAAIQGFFVGAKYLADKSTAKLFSSYRKTLSIDDYYTSTVLGIEKTYNQIHIRKYSKPIKEEQEVKIKEVLSKEFSEAPATTRGTKFAISDIMRKDKNDLLNFHAVIDIESNQENPSISRLKFSELYVFFSKTKVFTNEDLNALVSIKVEGQWRDKNGTPMQKVLIEQNYDFKKIKYGQDNQIKEPIVSPWYYDIPMTSDVEDPKKFGLLLVTIELKEYEGSKGKYVEKIPSLLDTNKKSILDGGTSALEKILD